mgnify:CR=1 FL=1
MKKKFLLVFSLVLCIFLASCRGNNNSNATLVDNADSTVYEQLKSNNMETGNHNHILNRTNEIILNPQEASLEDISSLLNYFNGKPVLIDGVAHHPFNDPMSASKLNNNKFSLACFAICFAKVFNVEKEVSSTSVICTATTRVYCMRSSR